MRNSSKKTRNLAIGSFLFYIFTFATTIFIFANTAEVVFNTNVPFVSSVHSYNSQNTLNKIVEEFIVTTSSRVISVSAKIDTLDHLAIPDFRSVIRIEEARKIEGAWFYRPSMIHQIALNKDEQGNDVDYLLYTVKSWKSVPYPEEIEVGMEMTLFTTKGTPIPIEVVERQVVKSKNSLLLRKTEKRQIILVVEDTKQNLVYGFSLTSSR